MEAYRDNVHDLGGVIGWVPSNDGGRLCSPTCVGVEAYSGRGRGMAEVMLRGLDYNLQCRWSPTIGCISGLLLMRLKRSSSTCSLPGGK